MKTTQTQRSELRAFGLVFLMSAMLVPASFLLAGAMSIDLIAMMNVSAAAAGLGVLATAPMLALLSWFMKTPNEKIARFRDSQIDFFADIGFRFTPARIVLISLAAGVGEELLFRGVLQTWAQAHMPVFAAIIATNVVFGLLHARTIAYALIAGVVGAYLGAVFFITGSLLVPIIAHALYDMVALRVTEREIRRRNQSGG